MSSIEYKIKLAVAVEKHTGNDFLAFITKMLLLGYFL